MCWSHVNSLWFIAVRDESSETRWRNQALAEMFKIFGFEPKGWEKRFWVFLSLCSDLLTCNAKTYIRNRDEKKQPWQTCPQGIKRGQRCAVCLRSTGVIKFATFPIFASPFICINRGWTYSLAVPFGWTCGTKETEAGPGVPLMKALPPQFFKSKALPQFIAGWGKSYKKYRNAKFCPLLCKSRNKLCVCISRTEHSLPSVVSGINDLCIGICCTYNFSSISVSGADPASFILKWLCPPHNATDLEEQHIMTKHHFKSKCDPLMSKRRICRACVCESNTKTRRIAHHGSFWRYWVTHPDFTRRQPGQGIPGVAWVGISHRCPSKVSEPCKNSSKTAPPLLIAKQVGPLIRVWKGTVKRRSNEQEEFRVMRRGIKWISLIFEYCSHYFYIYDLFARGTEWTNPDVLLWKDGNSSLSLCIPPWLRVWKPVSAMVGELCNTLL